jgi:multidrug efflux pump subunit AcrA (membrane-fusion protein)
MPDKEASMEPKPAWGPWEYDKYDTMDGIHRTRTLADGTEEYDGFGLSYLNDLEARLAAAEQQAQTLREQEVYWRRRVHSLRAEAQTLRAALVAAEAQLSKAQANDGSRMGDALGIIQAALNSQSVGDCDHSKRITNALGQENCMKCGAVTQSVGASEITVFPEGSTVEDVIADLHKSVGASDE